MEAFKRGYQYAAESTAAFSGAMSGERYVKDINEEIDKLCRALNSFEGNQLSDERLAGFMAEYWHSGTLNINAIIKGSSSRANTEGVNTFGSVDISTNFGKQYGSKYLQKAEGTAEAQGVSLYQKYMEYVSKVSKRGELPLSFEEFLKDRNYQGDGGAHSSMYAGQYRLVPSDQLETIKRYLEEKISKEAENRPEVAEKYREVLQKVVDRISDGKNESMPLSREEAILLAKMAKESGVSAEKLGLTTEDLVKMGDIFHNAIKAGTTAAIITMVLKAAPELYKVLECLIKRGELDLDQLMKSGKAAAEGGAEGLVRGTLAACLVSTCQAGLLGEAFKKINPSVIGACVVLSVEIFKDSYKVATGKMDKGQLVDNLMRGTVSMVCSAALGGAINTVIPVFGYMVGSFMGGIIGNLAYSATQNLCMSLCIESGWTMFGVVKQDYQIPRKILEEIGVEVFDYEKLDYARMEYSKFQYNTFSYTEFSPQTLDIIIVRRGVIGVRAIGYI